MFKLGDILPKNEVKEIIDQGKEDARTAIEPYETLSGSVERFPLKTSDFIRSAVKSLLDEHPLTVSEGRSVGEFDCSILVCSIAFNQLLQAAGFESRPPSALVTLPFNGEWPMDLSVSLVDKAGNEIVASRSNRLGYELNFENLQPDVEYAFKVKAG